MNAKKSVYIGCRGSCKLFVEHLPSHVIPEFSLLYNYDPSEPELHGEQGLSGLYSVIGVVRR
jgi:hypothetical protein